MEIHRDISDTPCLSFDHSDISASEANSAGVYTPDQQPRSGKWPARLRHILRMIAGAAIVVCVYGNLVTVYNATSQMSSRETDEVVIQEQRFAPVRQYLRLHGYKGEIGFITDTDLVPGRPWSFRDSAAYAETQYVMLPWMVLPGRRDTPFVIASFLDGIPAVPLERYSTLLDAGDGVVLLRRNP